MKKWIGLGLIVIGFFVSNCLIGVSFGDEQYGYVSQWGTAGLGDGQFKSPDGIAVDPRDGTVYVTDCGNNRVQKFRSDGTYLLQWGTRGSRNGQFKSPDGIVVDPRDGTVYVADTGNNRVQKFSSDGAYLLQWGTYGSGNRQFMSPYGIAVDIRDGTVYVTDSGNNRVQKFSSDGEYLLQWGTRGSRNGQFYFPDGIAVDSSGNVYVGDSKNNRVQKFRSDGTYLLQWGTRGSGNGQFTEIFANAGGLDSVMVDNSGNVYVADTGNNRIQKFNSNGEFTTKWGLYGSGNSRFKYPRGVAIDNDGNVYVTDERNNRIQKFSLAAPPAISLAITSRDPAPGSNSVDASIPAFTIAFNKEARYSSTRIDGLSSADPAYTNFIFQKKDTNGSWIDGPLQGRFTVARSADKKSFTLTRVSNYYLFPSTTYRVKVHGVKDINPNERLDDDTWVFTTSDPASTLPPATNITAHIMVKQQVPGTTGPSVSQANPETQAAAKQHLAQIEAMATTPRGSQVGAVPLRNLQNQAVIIPAIEATVTARQVDVNGNLVGVPISGTTASVPENMKGKLDLILEAGKKYRIKAEKRGPVQGNPMVKTISVDSPAQGEISWEIILPMEQIII